MGFKHGCLKPALIGCSGLLVIGLLFVILMAALARSSLDDTRVEEQELNPELAAPAAVVSADLGTTAGRVILELGQGEFEIHPARPGEGVRVEALYDRAVHELVDRKETLPDSTWLYHVTFRRTMPALQALFRQLMGESTQPYVHVYLPPDIPIDLAIRVEEGGFTADLGGLWIGDADIQFDKGGFQLEIDDPLREPMGSLVIRGRMGGFQAVDLGNASPRTLVVDCGMGGADIDLSGRWARDCDVSLSIKMGGMSVLVPDEVVVEGLSGSQAGLRPADPEVPDPPVLRLSLKQSMGEIDVVRR